MQANINFQHIKFTILFYRALVRINVCRFKQKVYVTAAKERLQSQVIASRLTQQFIYPRCAYCDAVGKSSVLPGFAESNSTIRSVRPAPRNLVQPRS